MCLLQGHFRHKSSFIIWQLIKKLRKTPVEVNVEQIWSSWSKFKMAHCFPMHIKIRSADLPKLLLIQYVAAHFFRIQLIFYCVVINCFFLNISNLHVDFFFFFFSRPFSNTIVSYDNRVLKLLSLIFGLWHFVTGHCKVHF